MVDKSFFEWLEALTKHSTFIKTSDLTDSAIEKQRPLELVTKFFACNYFPYRSEWDYHDFLDEAAVSLGDYALLDTSKKPDVSLMPQAGIASIVLLIFVAIVWIVDLIEPISFRVVYEAESSASKTAQVLIRNVIDVADVTVEPQIYSSVVKVIFPSFLGPPFYGDKVHWRIVRMREMLAASYANARQFAFFLEGRYRGKSVSQFVRNRPFHDSTGRFTDVSYDELNFCFSTNRRIWWGTFIQRDPADDNFWPMAGYKFYPRKFRGTNCGIGSFSSFDSSPKQKTDGNETERASETRCVKLLFGSGSSAIVGIQIFCIEIIACVLAGLGVFCFLLGVDSPDKKRRFIGKALCGPIFISGLSFSSWALFANPVAIWGLCSVY